MLANVLASLELTPGARVAVQAEKSVESLLFYLAVLRAGFVYLPLNTAYRNDELAYFIGNATPSVFICAPKDFARLSPLAFGLGTGFVFSLGDDRSGSLLERASHFPDQHTAAVRGKDELAAILYTSGTTGRSKGAMLTHGNLLSNALTLKRYWGWRRPEDGGDVLIHALPIFHVHGLFVASHCALLAGAKMLWLDRFDAKKVAALLPRATVFMGVPTLYVRLLGEASFTAEACRSMRLFISGSAPLLIETFDAFRERSGQTILERYGMSETLMLTSNPYDAKDGERRGGTVGFPLPGVELRVRDERGELVPRGEIGGIEVRGPNVFAGYWGMPEKTRGGVRRRRLVQDRRRRPRRRRWLRSHRRPQQGPHHQRRLQRLSGRSRGGAQRDAGRRRKRGGRRAARRFRRGRRCRGRGTRRARGSTPMP